MDAWMPAAHDERRVRDSNNFAEPLFFSPCEGNDLLLQRAIAQYFEFLDGCYGW